MGVPQTLRKPERERFESDSRRYSADACLDRAKRLINQATELEAGGSYMLGRAARIDATHLLARVPLEFLIVDPEAKL
jgi:hypothetical protein